MNSTDFQDNKLSNDALQWFSQIFSQCYEDLVNYARTIVYYKDCAEDVVQEAFIIGIQKKVALKESSNPVGWLYLTVQNVARNKNRKLLRLNKLIEEIARGDHKDFGKAEFSFEPYILFRESYKGLLKKDDWNLLIDFYGNGYAYKEMAEKYGKSISACKMQVMRAKNTLAKKITELQNET